MSLFVSIEVLQFDEEQVLLCAGLDNVFHVPLLLEGLSLFRPGRGNSVGIQVIYSFPLEPFCLMTTEELYGAFSCEQMLTIRNSSAERRSKARKDAETFGSICNCLRSARFAEFVLLPTVNCIEDLLLFHLWIARAKALQCPNQLRTKISANKVNAAPRFE